MTLADEVDRAIAAAMKRHAAAHGEDDSYELPRLPIVSYIPAHAGQDRRCVGLRWVTSVTTEVWSTHSTTAARRAMDDAR